MPAQRPVAPEQEMGDTLASRGPVSGESAPVTDSRHSTVLPKVEWSGETPRLVSTNRARFEELGVLGVGGMGEVVLVQDNDIGRNVALKRLPTDVDMGRVLRFVDEVRIVGSLEHPNIVPVHDVGVDSDGRFFFVMKKLEGQTLEAVIKSLHDGDPAAREKYSFPMRAQIFLKILGAVAYAHKQGYVHRDLKPANIMLGPYGEVTVMDWGLAKRIRSADGQPLQRQLVPSIKELDPQLAQTARPLALQTQLGEVMGTPLYMSPEQARGEHDKVDERSDIYSLTVLFYELLYLNHYLAGRTSLADVIEGVKSFTPPHTPRSDRRDDAVPPELSWFLMIGLQKNPTERFQSVEAMTEQLQRVLDGRFRMQCSRTLFKRLLTRTMQALDRQPYLTIGAMFTAFGLSAFAVGKLLFDLVRW